jgi:hypothetical protein
MAPLWLYNWLQGDVSSCTRTHTHTPAPFTAPAVPALRAPATCPTHCSRHLSTKLLAAKSLPSCHSCMYMSAYMPFRTRTASCQHTCGATVPACTLAS